LEVLHPLVAEVEDLVQLLLITEVQVVVRKMPAEVL